MSGLDETMTVHFRGAVAVLSGLVRASSINDSPPQVPELKSISQAWRFRNPDFERSIGALRDINKSGTLDEFFFLLRYYHFVGCSHSEVFSSRLQPHNGYFRTNAEVLAARRRSSLYLASIPNAHSG